MAFSRQAKAVPEMTYRFEDGVLYLHDAFVFTTVDAMLSSLFDDLETYPDPFLKINLDHLQRLDSAGVVALNFIQKQLQKKGVHVEIEGGSDSIRKILATFTTERTTIVREAERPGLLERVGGSTYEFVTDSLSRFLYVISDIFYWSVVDLFRRKTYRKGEFVKQADLIGVKAVPIIAALAFLIGLVLALQSATQLRQFGANRFIVDLTVIAMMREMGPLITAILVAGRSGSAIASEIATLKISEELDALTTMALNPTRFVIVPKMYACIFTLPFLTILADIFGIMGGMVTAFFSLDISATVFLNRMEDVLLFRDLVTGFIKSLVFAGIIVITGSFFGLQAERGADEVGQVTTASVVVAISLVIVADSILGLIFY